MNNPFTAIAGSTGTAPLIADKSRRFSAVAHMIYYLAEPFESHTVVKTEWLQNITVRLF